jgi:hypothetical protein
MKQLFFAILLVAGIGLFSSCKSTNADNYDSVWKPYSGTNWAQPSAIQNFSARDGGFTFAATISQTNAVDTLGVVLPFSPSMYVISNIESGSTAQFAVSASVSSPLDSMKLKTIVIDPVKHDTTRYAYFQFGRVRGTVQTSGINKVLTAPRAFGSDGVFTYAPSIHPDSCSQKITLQLIVNWNNYTGAAVLDTLKTTTISVQVKNMSLTVSGIAILK